MAVNSVLEGFLTLYGWHVYASLFLLLVAVGAVIYPVARIVFDAAIHYGETQGSPDLGARSLMIRLSIYALVLALGLIPVVPLEITRTSVQNQCARDTLNEAFNQKPALHNEEYGFGHIDSARVPVLPYLAMLLAAGFNAVLYEAIPCVHNLVQVNRAMNMLNYAEADDPNALRANVSQFDRECYQPALSLYQDFITGRHGSEGTELMRNLMEQYASNPTERREQMVLIGSEFYQNVFYQACPALTLPPTDAAAMLCNMLPLRASSPVEGFGYDADRDSDASAQQVAAGEGLPTCHEWWNTPGIGLRSQIALAGDRSLTEITRELKATRCRGLLGPEFAGHQTCLENLKAGLAGYEDLIVRQMQLAPQRNLLLDQSTQTLLGWGAVGLGVASLFGFSDAAAAMAKSVAGYYTSLYMFKIGAGLFQPFLLMTVFILWGVFMVIGEMRGMIVVKGMMLIFVLSILPALWSLADHIGNQLFLALYPNAPLNPLSLTQLFGEHSTVERIVLDIVTTTFYVVLPLLMLYLVAEAGGPKQSTGMTSEGVNNPARGLGGIAGGAIQRSSARSPRTARPPTTGR